MPSHNSLDNYSGPEQKETNAYLKKVHGDGHTGYQRFRLVHSSSVLELSAGDWNDWDENLAVELRGRIVAGETGRELVGESCAERRIIEMRRVPKYPEFADYPGWILEAWQAPAYYGSPSEWNSYVVPGTHLPHLGPYPHRGGYESCMGLGIRPFPEAPTGPFLDRVIEQWELMRDLTLAYSKGAYVRKRDFEAHERQKALDEKWNRETREANMTALMPFNSTFLEGGKARQLAVEHAGLSSNYGN